MREREGGRSPNLPVNTCCRSVMDAYISSTWRFYVIRYNKPILWCCHCYFWRKLGSTSLLLYIHTAGSAVLESLKFATLHLLSITTLSITGCSHTFRIHGPRSGQDNFSKMLHILQNGLRHSARQIHSKREIQNSNRGLAHIISIFHEYLKSYLDLETEACSEGLGDSGDINVCWPEKGTEATQAYTIANQQQWDIEKDPKYLQETHFKVRFGWIKIFFDSRLIKLIIFILPFYITDIDLVCRHQEV